MSSSKLRALQGMGYSRSEEMKKKDDEIALRREQMAARERMPARERESAEAFEADEARRESVRLGGRKKGIIEDISDVFGEFFIDESSPVARDKVDKTSKYGTPRGHTFRMRK